MDSQILPFSPLDLEMRHGTFNYIKKEKSTSSLMPLTFCLAHINTDVLKFNWEFYVTCRWQETYYSLFNTCRPPRSSSIQSGTLNKRAAWCACIIQHFHRKCLVKSENFPPVSMAQLGTFHILQRYAKRFSQSCTSWFVFLPARTTDSLFHCTRNG